MGMGTPTVYINGQDLGDNLDYSTIRNALCSADPSLSGCSAPVPDGEQVVVVRVCPWHRSFSLSVLVPSRFPLQALKPHSWHPVESSFQFSTQPGALWTF